MIVACIYGKRWRRECLCDIFCLLFHNTLQLYYDFNASYTTDSCTNCTLKNLSDYLTMGGMKEYVNT